MNTFCCPCCGGTIDQSLWNKQAMINCPYCHAGIHTPFCFCSSCERERDLADAELGIELLGKMKEMKKRFPDSGEGPNNVRQQPVQNPAVVVRNEQGVVIQTGGGMTCYRCKRNIPTEARFCPHCGVRL